MTSVTKLPKKVLDVEHEEGINNQFEVLLVPNEMIVYRNWFVGTTTFSNATFVPFNIGYESRIVSWLYGDKK